ncbi:MAG: periplasmic nitrate reductase, NapE protein [Xanthobacteraceae bacterium]|jgi:nitrate reductase NapE
MIDPTSSDNLAFRDGAVPRNSRREELFAFLVLAVLIWPAVAVGVVGGYGFIVWMSQIVFGPPGPPQAH